MRARAGKRYRKDGQDREKHIEEKEKGQRQWLRLLIKQRCFGVFFYFFIAFFLFALIQEFGSI